jgi:hypothetical protein
MWKVLHSETWSLCGEDHHWFKRTTGVKRRVKRDDDDNNDDDDDDDDDNNNNNNNNNDDDDDNTIIIIIIPRPQKRWLLQWAAMANTIFSELHSPCDKPIFQCNLPVPTIIHTHSLPWPSVPRLLSDLPLVFYRIENFICISQCYNLSTINPLIITEMYSFKPLHDQQYTWPRGHSYFVRLPRLLMQISRLHIFSSRN